MIDGGPDARQHPFRLGEGPVDTSPYGVRDMGGNASELTGDEYTYDPFEACGDPCADPFIPVSREAVGKGANICSCPSEAHPYGRFPGPADRGSNRLGFRCAADARESSE